MTIFLDALELPASLRLDPSLESLPKIAIETMPTRGGNDLKWMKAIKDIPFDLVGGDNWGGVAFSTIQAMAAKADTLDYEGVLNFHGTLYTVYFRHNDSPVIEFENKFGGIPTATQLMLNVKFKFVWKVA